MAKQLDDIVDLRKQQARHTKYPWHDWQNGKVWEAIHGEDFTITVESFRTTLHLRAKNTRTKCITTTGGLPEGHVRFQFVNAPHDPNTR